MLKSAVLLLALASYSHAASTLLPTPTVSIHEPHESALGTDGIDGRTFKSGHKLSLGVSAGIHKGVSINHAISKPRPPVIAVKKGHGQCRRPGHTRLYHAGNRASGAFRKHASITYAGAGVGVGVGTKHIRRQGQCKKKVVFGGAQVSFGAQFHGHRHQKCHKRVHRHRHVHRRGHGHRRVVFGGFRGYASVNKQVHVGHPNIHVPIPQPHQHVHRRVHRRVYRQAHRQIIHQGNHVSGHFGAHAQINRPVVQAPVYQIVAGAAASHGAQGHKKCGCASGGKKCSCKKCNCKKKQGVNIAIVRLRSMERRIRWLKMRLRRQQAMFGQQMRMQYQAYRGSMLQQRRSIGRFMQMSHIHQLRLLQRMKHKYQARLYGMQKQIGIASQQAFFTGIVSGKKMRSCRKPLPLLPHPQPILPPRSPIMPPFIPKFPIIRPPPRPHIPRPQFPPFMPNFPVHPFPPQMHGKCKSLRGHSSCGCGKSTGFASQLSSIYGGFSGGGSFSGVHHPNSPLPITPALPGFSGSLAISRSLQPTNASAFQKYYNQKSNNIKTLLEGMFLLGTKEKTCNDYCKQILQNEKAKGFVKSIQVPDSLMSLVDNKNAVASDNAQLTTTLSKCLSIPYNSIPETAISNEALLESYLSIYQVSVQVNNNVTANPDQNELKRIYEILKPKLESYIKPGEYDISVQKAKCGLKE